MYLDELLKSENSARSSPVLRYAIIGQYFEAFLSFVHNTKYLGI